MKARYRVFIKTTERTHEFETVIERSDSSTNEELTAALFPKAMEYLETLGGDESSGTRGGFNNVFWEYLGPA